jgi:hypothetical protein
MNHIIKAYFWGQNYFEWSTLRISPFHLVRFRGEFLNTALKVSDVISSQSFFDHPSISGLGLNKGS